MAKNKRFACSGCHTILKLGEDQCNSCPDSPVTLDWRGYVIILDGERAEVAKRLGITRSGEYALKVNIR